MVKELLNLLCAICEGIVEHTTCCYNLLDEGEREQYYNKLSSIKDNCEIISYAEIREEGGFSKMYLFKNECERIYYLIHIIIHKDYTCALIHTIYF